MSRPRARCVRCGRNERAVDAFLCVPCLADPITRWEIYDAERREHDGMAQRRYLVAVRHWAGEWPRL